MSSYHRNGYGTLDETGAPDVFLRGRLRIHGELFRVTVKKGHKPGLYTIKAWPAKSDPHKPAQQQQTTRREMPQNERGKYRATPTPITTPATWRPGQPTRVPQSGTIGDDRCRTRHR